MIVAFLLAFYFLSDPPFKAKEDFEVKLELSFKQRIPDDNKSVHPSETRKEYERRTSTAVLPYLRLYVTVLKTQPEEIRVKVFRDGRSMTTKKTSDGIKLKIEAGFTDDIKDGISGYKHEIHFLSEEKEVMSRILIEFDNDGNYTVNGEKRGKI